MNQQESVADVWAGFGWDPRVQEKPKPGDMPPVRTHQGWVLFHGTGLDAAERIVEELLVRPDDFKAVGVGPLPSAVRVYSLMKPNPRIVRLIVSAEVVATARIRHEWGGSGANQWLFRAPHGSGGRWDGLPLVEARILNPS